MQPLDLEDSEQLLRAVGESSRLRLLHLCATGEFSVSDLMAVVDQSQPRVSRHLKILCDAGLLERFRDGQWVYFRVPLTGVGAERAAYVLSLTDLASPLLVRDRQRLQAELGESHAHPDDATLRRFNRIVLDQFLSHPVGELLDIGVGSGAILRLLAARALSAVGIDSDANQRRRARRSFARKSLANCTIRKGDMHRLDYDDDSFDTVVLDEVLLASDRPEVLLQEGSRVLRASGRLLLIEHAHADQVAFAATHLTELAATAGLRCSTIRQSFDGDHKYLVALASVVETENRKQA